MMNRDRVVSDILESLSISKSNSIPVNVKKEVNAYLADFCRRYREPREVAKLWDTLDKLYDVEVGMITGYPYKSASGGKYWTTTYKYKGVEISNSKLVYQVYEPDSDSSRAEYNIYLS